MSKTVGIIFPVYNEENRISRGIEIAYKFIDNLKIDYLLLIVDNGSTDRTEEIAKELCERYKSIRYKRIHEKGVGIAFKTGVKELDVDIVGYMDIDMATDIKHFEEVLSVFAENEDVDLVNASRFSKQSITTGRKKIRNITSYGLIILLKAVFGMEASDAVCGFKFFNRNSALQLISESSGENGWFYIIEILLRAERDNMKIVELPVYYEDDADNSKVNIITTIFNYIFHIIKLKKEFLLEQIEL